MADRFVLKQFAGSATNNGAFGAAQATGAGVQPVANIEDVQSLNAFEQGWDSATLTADKLPALEEMQGLEALLCKAIKENYSEGIPFWISGETYYQHSFVNYNGVIYYNTTGSYTANNPAIDTANWAQYKPATAGAADTAAVADKLGVTTVGSETQGIYLNNGVPTPMSAGFANQDLSNLSATGQAIIDSKQDIATAVNYDNITNCITEIPQDIKLELNNGTLTLKAGSKVYKLDGTSVSITSDATISTSYYGFNQQSLIYYLPDSNTLEHPNVFICFSGNGYPTITTYQYMLYFDATNKKYYWTGDSGSSWTERTSATYPIAIATVGDSNWESIDKVFNGFGYIGSTVFALPGVKGLVPNGRNADGSLKNIESTLTRVHTCWLDSAWGTEFSGHKFYLRVFDESAGYPGDVQPNTRVISGKVFPSGYTGFFYNTDENTAHWVESGVITANDKSFIGATFIANITDSTFSVAGGFTPKTVFHAVDYGDFVEVTDSKADKSQFQVVSALPANPDPNVFYFIPE